MLTGREVVEHQRRLSVGQVRPYSGGDGFAWSLTQVERLCHRRQNEVRVTNRCEWQR